MAKGAAKGIAYEHEVAEILSLWVSSGGQPNIYRRHPKSGTDGVEGDITWNFDTGKWLVENFVIEVKYYKDLDSQFWSFFSGESSNFFINTFRQVVATSNATERSWIAWIKANNRKPILFTDSKAIYDLSRH